MPVEGKVKWLRKLIQNVSFFTPRTNSFMWNTFAKLRPVELIYLWALRCLGPFWTCLEFSCFCLALTIPVVAIFYFKELTLYQVNIKYMGPVKDCQQAGWRARCFLVEVDRPEPSLQMCSKASAHVYPLGFYCMCNFQWGWTVSTPASAADYHDYQHPILLNMILFH